MTPGYQSKKVFKNLGNVLRAKAQYHPDLKIIAYNKDNKEEDLPVKRYYRRICTEADKMNVSVPDLNNRTKYLNNPTIPGFFLENLLGYERI